MLIAIIGTRCSGKSALKEYLTQKGCIPLYLRARTDSIEVGMIQTTVITFN